MEPADDAFFVAGGTLAGDAASYVPRQADHDLLAGLGGGEYCCVLTSRQMGKSSLMVRTAGRLRAGGASVALLDLTAVGQNLSAEQWYDGLLAVLARQLGLEAEFDAYWLGHRWMGPLQRWVGALREVVLGRCPGRVVVFVDEIDAVRGLPFPTDEFFAAVRECHNRRTSDPAFGRLAFCLLGVATPSDLVRDARTTPFNVGRRVEVADFGAAEAAPLAAGLGRAGGGRAGALLGRVLHWTGGHPYLTQRLCRAAAGLPAAAGPADVDRLCEDLFLTNRARERDENLMFVRDRMLRGEADPAGLLDLYARVIRRPQPDDETNRLAAALRLAGVARVADGRLRVRNRIYERVFDAAWVAASMPDAERRRQRRAYRRGVARASAALLTVFLAVCGMGAVAWRKSLEAQRANDESQAVQRGQRMEKELRRGEITRRVEARLQVPPRPDRLSPHPTERPDEPRRNNLGEFKVLEDYLEVDLRDWRRLAPAAPLHSTAYTLNRHIKVMKVREADTLWLEASTSGRDLVRRVLQPNPHGGKAVAPARGVQVGGQPMISRSLGFDTRSIPVHEEFDCRSISTYWDALQKPEDQWFGVIGYAGSFRVSMLLLFPAGKPYTSFELKVAPQGSASPAESYTGNKIVYEDEGRTWLYWEVPTPEAAQVYQLHWQW